MMWNPAVVLAVVGSVPVGALAIVSATWSISMLLDPCQQWGTPSERSDSLIGRRGELSGVVPPEATDQNRAPCTGRVSSTTETKEGAVGRLLGISGGLLIASGIGIIGAIRGTRRLVMAGAFVLLIETAVILTMAPLTLVAAILLFLSARQIPTHPVLNARG